MSEQVAREFGWGDRMLADSGDVAEVCRAYGVSDQTYYRWRLQVGGLIENSIADERLIDRLEGRPRTPRYGSRRDSP